MYMYRLGYLKVIDLNFKSDVELSLSFLRHNKTNNS